MLLPEAWWFMAPLFLIATAVTGSERPAKPFSPDSEESFNECLCVSRDGKRLALNAWTIWDISSAKRVLSGQTRCCQSSAFSPDGNLFTIGGSYSEFFVIDAHTGKVVWDLTLVGHGDTILSHVAFTPDGKSLVSSSDNGMVRVWDLRTKTAQALFCFPSKYDLYNGCKEYLRAWRALSGDKPPDGVKAFVVQNEPIKLIYQFAISPDSKTVAVAPGTPEAWLMDPASGKVLRKFRTEQVSVMSVCFSDDGRLLLIGGGDDEHDTKRCTIEVWDVVAGRRKVTCPGHRHSVLHLAVSPDGKTIASGGTIDGVRVWDLATGEQKYALHQAKEVRISGIAILPDGKTLLTLPHNPGESVYFWDLAAGKPISGVEVKPSK
jgi:WD40 repeat protein